MVGLAVPSRSALSPRPLTPLKRYCPVSYTLQLQLEVLVLAMIAPQSPLSSRLRGRVRGLLGGREANVAAFCQPMKHARPFSRQEALLSGSLHPPLVQPVPRMTPFQRPPYIVRQYLQKPTQRGAPGLSPRRTPPSFRGADRRGAGQVGRCAAPRAIPPICRLCAGGNPSPMIGLRTADTKPRASTNMYL